jgi:hypothetical protein
VTFSAGLTAAAALAVVLGLVLATARVARGLGLATGVARPGPGDVERRLVLLESLPLDGRRRLQLVRCGRQDLVVLTGGTHDQVLRLPRPEAAS